MSKILLYLLRFVSYGSKNGPVQENDSEPLQWISSLKAKILQAYIAKQTL